MGQHQQFQQTALQYMIPRNRFGVILVDIDKEWIVE